MVGVSPITHGTTLSGIATIAKALQVFYPAEPLFDKIAPSFYEMGKYFETSCGTVCEVVVFFCWRPNLILPFLIQVNNSSFIAKLNAGGDTSPGVIHSNIATK